MYKRKIVYSKMQILMYRIYSHKDLKLGMYNILINFIFI